MMNNVSRVFVSHASEDKERFVINFATKLREKGIDAWVDRWEMFPGDSLVDKIFEEGLKDANAVLIVLSRFSVNKPWVREELNAAVVKRIDNGTKLIPVIIDDCEIPEALKSTLWMKINNLNSYSKEFERICMAILGISDKPPLGNSPVFTSLQEKLISGLNKTDSLIFKICCESVIANNNNMITINNIKDKAFSYDLSEMILVESIKILNDDDYLKITATLGNPINFFNITKYGLEQYLYSCYDKYEELTEKICYELVNRDLTDNIKLTKEMGISKIISNHILDMLEANGLIQTQSLGLGSNGFRIILKKSPKLRRILDK